MSRQSVTPVSIKCVEKEKYKLHECGEIIWSRNGTSLELNYVQAAWTEEFINWIKFLKFLSFEFYYLQKPRSKWSTKQTIINFYQVLKLWTGTAAKCVLLQLCYEGTIDARILMNFTGGTQPAIKWQNYGRNISSLLKMEEEYFLNWRTKSLNVCIMFQMIKYV